MNVLVVGGTGMVGGQVALALRERGARVTVLTRSRAKLAAMPTGIAGAVGDFEDEAALAAALAGIEGVFLATPLSRRETEHGLAVAKAAERAGVSRLVFMSVANLEEGAHIPHFATKQPIEEALRSSSVAHTVLRPNNFFQNDLWFEESIVLHGIYPQPVGSVGVSRIDIRDIADAAVNALLTDGHVGQTYTLSGPDELDGDEIAAAYSRHLDRPVVYAGDDLEAWARQASASYPAWLVADLSVMYRHFQRIGMLASDTDLARQRRLVGRAPRVFEEFVCETASVWRGKVH